MATTFDLLERIVVGIFMVYVAVAFAFHVDIFATVRRPFERNEDWSDVLFEPSKRALAFFVASGAFFILQFAVGQVP